MKRLDITIFYPLEDWTRVTDHSNLSTGKAADILTHVNLKSPKMDKVLRHPNLSDSRAKAICDEENWVSYYDFRGRGGTLHDNSEHGNDGEINGATWSQSALLFDGSDDYVEVPHDASLNTTPISIAIWFSQDRSGGDYARLLTKGTHSEQYNFNPYQPGPPQNAGFEIYVGGTKYTVVSDIEPPANEFHFYVATYDGETMYLYRDDAGQVDSNTSPSGDIDTTTSRIRMGYDDATDEWFGGTIYWVAIWSRVLSESEATDFYNKTKPTT